MNLPMPVNFYLENNNCWRSNSLKQHRTNRQHYFWSRKKEWLLGLSALHLCICFADQFLYTDQRGYCLYNFLVIFFLRPCSDQFLQRKHCCQIRNTYPVLLFCQTNCL